MEILFVAGFSPIVPDPIVGRTFYQEALGSGHRPTSGARRPAGGRVLVPVDAR